MQQLTTQHVIGSQIATVFDQLAALRIAVFRDYPYLYEGSVDYEKTYLKTYAQSDRAMLFTVFDGEQLIGATTCIPLRDETDETQEPFRRMGYDLNTIFYFGESLLLPAYRGQKLGHRFFDERESYVRWQGSYTMTAFCAVQRPADDPRRPADYRPLDAFWLQRGYQPNSSLQTTFSWPDIGETESTPKLMQFWTKPIS